MSPEQRKRLSYVVPGYVWQQGDFDIDIQSVQQILDFKKGVIVIESPSVPIREYAAASILGYLQARDYHADIGWTSFFPRVEDEFTGAVKTPKHREFQVIAIKTLLNDLQIEQVQDLAVLCRVAIIATCGIDLKIPHTVLKFKANTAERITI